MDLDYKSMSDDKLKEIISKISLTAQDLMDDISPLLKEPMQSHKTQEKRDAIVAQYARLKEWLKTMYHYINLGKNSTSEANFYNAFFCPAIRDCYLACRAKTTEKNLQKVSASLWEVWSEARYHIPSDTE